MLNNIYFLFLRTKQLLVINKINLSVCVTCLQRPEHKLPIQYTERHFGIYDLTLYERSGSSTILKEDISGWALAQFVLVTTILQDK